MTRYEKILTLLGSRPQLLNISMADDDFEAAGPVRCEEGVCLIEICGALANNPDWWAEACGAATSYRTIQAQIAAALEDDGCRAILLRINSPGGETDNAFETADCIRAAAKKKPVWACADTMAYSAAYLLASAASKIYCTPITGGVGSIGVWTMHADYSKMLASQGIGITLISAGTGKTDGNPYEPLSDEARKRIEAEVSRLYYEFASAVALGRGLKQIQVIDLGAKLYEGATAAIAAGLADVSGDFASAWADLASEVQVNPPSVGQQPVQVAWQAASQAQPISEAANVQASANSNLPHPATTAAVEITKEKSAMTDPVIPAVAVPTAAAAAGVAAVPDAQAIAELCMIAGKPVLCAEFIQSGLSLEAVRAKLLEARAEGSDASQVNGAHSGLAAKPPITALQQAADAIRTESRGLTKEQAFAQALQHNPELYQAYLHENPAQTGGRY